MSCWCSMFIGPYFQAHIASLPHQKVFLVGSRLCQDFSPNKPAKQRFAHSTLIGAGMWRLFGTLTVCKSGKRRSAEDKGKATVLGVKRKLNSFSVKNFTWITTYSKSGRLENCSKWMTSLSANYCWGHSLTSCACCFNGVRRTRGVRGLNWPISGRA